MPDQDRIPTGSTRTIAAIIVSLLVSEGASAATASGGERRASKSLSAALAPLLLLLIGAGGAAQSAPASDRQTAFESGAEAQLAIEDGERREAVENAVRTLLGTGRATREDLEAEERDRVLLLPHERLATHPAPVTSRSSSPTVFGPAPKRWRKELLDENADDVLRGFLAQQVITPAERLATFSGALSIPDESDLWGPSRAAFTEWTTIGSGMFHSLGAARHSAGRIRQVEYVYDDELGVTTLYAASSGGGLFRLVPLILFAVWQPISDNLPAEPMVGGFVVDRTNSRRILIATGDWGRRGGSGIWRTIDGGASWTASSVAGGPAVNHYRIRQDRINEEVVLAVGSRTVNPPDATPAGIWRSTNFGASFQQVYSGIVTDIVQHPTNAMWWYAAAPGLGVLRSIDGGQSFSPFGPLAGHTGGRISYAIAPTNPSLHYLLAADPDGNMFGIFRSWTSGETWGRIDAGDSISWGLGNSMNAIGVDPDDAGRLFIGMGGMQSSDNADAAVVTSICWAYCACNGVPAGTCAGPPPLRPPFAHADFTGFTFVPDAVVPGNQTVLWTTDGGIHAYDWGTNTVDSTINTLGLTAAQQWENQENSLAAAHHTDPNLLLAGTFDNGIVDIDLARAQRTRTKTGGDGAMVAFSPDDERDKSGSFGLGWRRFIEIDDGGANSIVECSGVAPWGAGGLSEDGAPSIAIDRTPGFGDLVYTADTGFLYQKALTPTCDWVQAGTARAVPSGFNIRSFDQANNSLRWVFYITARGSEKLWVFDGINLPAISRQERTPPILPRTRGGTASAFADRSSLRPNTVYYATGSSLPPQAFVSDDRGQVGSWVEVTGNLATALPNGGFRELIGNPSNPNQLFMATNVGVFRSDNRGTSWYRYMNGLPAVIDAMSIELVHDGAAEPTLFFGSFGRGWWRRAIDAPASEWLIFADGFESGGVEFWD